MSEEMYPQELIDEYYNAIQELHEALNDKDQQITDLQHEKEVIQKALELAVNDKCYAENCIAESFIGKGAKVRFPKKEQWYLEQAKEMMKSD